MNYDVIGDIHGHAEALKALLAAMGYRERGGAWRHSERMALFVGDLIDRGCWVAHYPSQYRLAPTAPEFQA